MIHPAEVFTKESHSHLKQRFLRRI